MLGFISPTRRRKGSATSSSPVVRMVAGLQEGGPGTASPRAKVPHRPHWLDLSSRPLCSTSYGAK